MPEPLHDESPKRRRPWLVLAGLCVVVVAFAVLAWQQGSNGGGDGPLNAIAEAAERTQSEPGGRATMHGIFSSPGQPAIAMTGEMVYDSEGRTQGVVTVPHPKTGGPAKVDVAADGTHMYMRVGRVGASSDESKWMGFDLALGQKMETPVPADVNTKGELELLEQATGGVKKLGREDVHGVPTTHYRGTIGVAGQVKRMREEGMEDAASYVEKNGSPFHVEAWIDAEGLVRRMRIVQTQSTTGKGPTTIDMRIDFSDFGLEPEIEIPDSSEVLDLTPMLRKQVDSKSGE